MNMKKKHFIAVAAFLLGASAPVQAQINDDEITVITEDGTEDVIELPEGLTTIGAGAFAGSHNITGINLIKIGNPEIEIEHLYAADQQPDR